MSESRIVLLFFVVSALISCSEKKQEPQKPETGIRDTIPTREVRYFDFNESEAVWHIDDSSGIIGQDPKIIYQPDMDFGAQLTVRTEPIFEEVSLQWKNSRLPENFTANDVLQKLFGGKVNYTFNDDETDSIAVAWWNCTNCTADTVPYLGDSSLGRLFPDSQMNSTWVNGIYEFTFEEMPFRFISLASFPDEFAISFTGRFSGAVMGYVLLMKASIGWRVIDFNAAVGMYGTYKSPMEPDIRIVNERPFFIYECRNGGAGAPYVSHADVFVYDRLRLNKITTETFLSCENNAMGEWDSEYRFYHKSGMEIPGLNIITYGYYIGDNHPMENYPYVFKGLNYELKAEFVTAEKSKKPIRFILQKQYSGNYGTRMGMGQYQIKTEILKGKWVTKKVKAD